MPSDIDIASNALILIGDNPISAFTEPGAGPQAAKNLFESTYHTMLSLHFWSFATTLKRLNRLSDPDKVAGTGFANAFQLPTDCIRLEAIQGPSNYDILGDIILTDSQDIFARYVVATSVANAPADFAKALEYKLASEFAMLVTEDEGKAHYYEQKYQIALAAAITSDSQATLTEGFIDSPFIRVRHG